MPPLEAISPQMMSPNYMSSTYSNMAPKSKSNNLTFSSNKQLLSPLSQTSEMQSFPLYAPIISPAMDYYNGAPSKSVKHAKRTNPLRSKSIDYNYQMQYEQQPYYNPQIYYNYEYDPTKSYRSESDPCHDRPWH